MHVLVVSPEIAPLTPGGDLAATAGGLVQALCQIGLEVTVVVPFDDRVSTQRHALARRLRKLTVQASGKTHELGLLEGTVGTSNARVFLLDHPSAFQAPHGGDDSRLLRAELLAGGALQLMQDYPLEPDVLHAFGPDAALVAARAKKCPELASRPTRVVLTQVDPDDLGTLSPSDRSNLAASLDLSASRPEGEPDSLLAAGLEQADVVAVPSTNLADVLSNTARPGARTRPFDSLGKPVVGVLPGLDYGAWSPTANRRIPAQYSEQSLVHKQICKQALLTRLGLVMRPRVPLVALPASSVTTELAQRIMPSLTQSLTGAIQLALFGAAPEEAHPALREMSQQHSADVGWLAGAEGDALHLLLAGCDAIIALPAHPATLIDLLFKALCFGTIPLATRDSVAQDVIVDYDVVSRTGTGLLTTALDGPSLVAAIQRLVDLYLAEHRWRPLQRNAMQQRFEWAATAAHYEHVYRGLLAEPEPPPAVDGGL